MVCGAHPTPLAKPLGVARKIICAVTSLRTALIRGLQSRVHRTVAPQKCGVIHIQTHSYGYGTPRLRLGLVVRQTTFTWFLGV